MKHQKIIGTVLTVCVFLLSLTGCTPSFEGNSVKNADCYELDIEAMNGTDLHSLELKEGDTLQIQFEMEKGSLDMELTAEELVGPWHLAVGENDESTLNEIFPGAMEFGSGMEITGDGNISWYIGAEGGTGTYTLDRDTLHMETTSDLDGSAMTFELRAERTDGELSLVMEVKDLSLRWTQGEGETGKGEEEAPEEEPWKTAFEEDLFENYGVIPKYYEDLGNGLYQVYVEIGGEVVPYVTVDSATGNYHG